MTYRSPDAWRSWVNLKSPHLLRRYVDDIADAERLSPSELAEMTERVIAGDEQATERLLLAHLQLVVYIAKDYVGRSVDEIELIQQGNIGLIRAVDDLTKMPRDMDLIDYLSMAIRGAVDDWLKAH